MYLHFVYICFQENESDYFWNFKMICKSFEVLETKCLCHPVPKMFFRKVVFLLTKVFHEDTIQSYLLFLSISALVLLSIISALQALIISV